MAKNRRSVQEIAVETEPIATMTSTPTSKLRAKLEEIQNYNGVSGFILRNSRSASIDLKDPAKIIDYAILSSSAIDNGDEFCKLFELGDINSITLEGKNAKMLSLSIDENTVSVFMEKDVDCERIIRKLQSH